MKEVNLAELKKDFDFYREILRIEMVSIIENDEPQYVLVPFEGHKSLDSALPSRSIPLSEFEKKLDSKRDTSQLEAAVLTENNEPQIVVLTIEKYRSLRAAMPQRAFHVSELPEDVIRAILDEEIPDNDEWPDAEPKSRES